MCAVAIEPYVNCAWQYVSLSDSLAVRFFFFLDKSVIYLALQYNTLHYREYDLLTLTTVRFDESCGCAFKRDEWTPGRCNSCCNQSRAEVEKHCDNWTGKIIWNRNRSNQTRECWSDPLISPKVAPTLCAVKIQLINKAQNGFPGDHPYVWGYYNKYCTWFHSNVLKILHLL